MFANKYGGINASLTSEGRSSVAGWALGDASSPGKIWFGFATEPVADFSSEETLYEVPKIWMKSSEAFGRPDITVSTGYVRQEYEFSSAYTQADDPAWKRSSSGVYTNTKQITWDPATGEWPTVNAWFISVSPSGGPYISTGPTTFDVAEGDVVIIGEGAINFTVAKML